jgi:hypothetical protein
MAKGTPEEIGKLQARVQQLYDIPIFEFTPENVTELQTLKKKAGDMGYKQAEDDTIYNIHYVPKRNSR